VAKLLDAGSHVASPTISSSSAVAVTPTQPPDLCASDQSTGDKAMGWRGAQRLPTA
jgi:hypothetical protein